MGELHSDARERPAAFVVHDNEQQTVRMALATFTHHSAPRGKKTARAGEEDNEMHFTATFRANPPPQAAGTQYSCHGRWMRCLSRGHAA